MFFNKRSITSRQSTKCSSSDSLSESDESFSEFYYCQDAQWVMMNCPTGKVFNSLLQTCITDKSESANNQQIESTKGNVCLSNETKTNEMNCGSYFVCFEGTWWLRYCEEGSYFNTTQKLCINEDGTGTCTKKRILKQPCVSGSIERMNCSSYFICVDSNWTANECPNDHYFNVTLKACLHDDAKMYSNGSGEQQIERKFDPKNCRTFKLFLNDEWISVSCPVDFHYDISLEKCILNNGECSRDGTLRRNCTDQTLQPNFVNSTEFYQCFKAKWHLESCMSNYHFNKTLQRCVLSNDTFKMADILTEENYGCINKTNGFSYSHKSDCSRFYFCEDGLKMEGVCQNGTFFDITTLQCHTDRTICSDKNPAFDNYCQNSTNSTVHRNPANCSTFITCINNSAILTPCPSSQYFDSDLSICQPDISKCFIENQQCDDSSISQYPHEKYCSVYYTCIGKKLVPIACDDSYYFDSALGKCVPDHEHLCIDGYFKANNTDEMIHADISCTDRQGDIFPDTKNCNKFYVCINNQLRHDKCFEGEFFDNVTNACTPKTVSGDKSQTNVTETLSMKCSKGDSEINYADHTDCRKFYQCNDDQLISKKCRNGESFDNLLGFCRQNDGTCLIENGQRVGACANKHGKFVEDVDNCQQYFACINGQKISKTCKMGEYFDKTRSKCEKDLNGACSARDEQMKSDTKLNCDGLDELVFYANLIEDCKSFFQCIDSVPRLHKCPQDFRYDSNSGSCEWKDNVKCS